ncbi:MAG: ABC transporter permease [Anaerolineae bacterium]|nr:ABC transporter permease [Anaerolineae bacterium]MCB0229333.1 ABC transporter permease [Anaerolineae bacterium]MCB0236773.1 ABC transporter permease [Anaerolineae bacterium]MCB0245495.1 ABC transporter permease [Anaerolineae bacterium]
MAVKSTVPPRSDPPGQEPPPTVVIKATSGLSALQLGAVWEYRELLYFMVWRDVKVRYKQTALGVIWVILQPLLSTLVFTVIFGVLLNVPSNGLPYPIFAYAGLLPWQYFASSLTRTSTNLVDNANLITKVYFPRLTIPLSGVLASLVDFAVGLVMLAVLMLIYRIPLTPAVLLLPLFLLLAMITALGFGLWLSALNVRYRDIKQLIPFIVQLWMYLTPVIWPVTIIPERFRSLLALNPMTGVVSGFRWALLGDASAVTGMQAPAGLFALSVVIAVAALISGMFFFRSTERTFADII